MYQPQDFSFLKGIEGLSEQLLENHFSLYQGYVTNTNKDLKKISQLMLDGKESENEYMELKRRLGWEFNGMRLHEYYFMNLHIGGTPLKDDSPLAKKISADFGSFEAWEKDFRAMAAMRGIGWVVLYYDKQADRLLNVWINEHDAGHLAGGVPILVFDVFEHAYMLNYGTKKAGYIDFFMKNACWEAAMMRFDATKKE